MDELIFFHSFGKADKTASQVYSALKKETAPFEAYLADLVSRSGTSVPESLGLRFKPWLESLDSEAGGGGLNAQQGLNQSGSWALFSDRVFDEQEFNKLLEELGPARTRPNLLMVIFVCGSTNDTALPTWLGHISAIIHQRAAHTARALAGAWYAKKLEKLAELDVLALVTLQQPLAGAFFRNGILMGSDLSRFPEPRLGSELEIFNWAYEPHSLTVRERREYSLQLSAWPQDTAYPKPASAVGLANACRHELQQNRLAEAERIATALIAQSAIVNGAWSMPWFLKGKIELGKDRYEPARFYFKLALYLQPNSFLAAAYAAIALLPLEPLEGFDELDQLLASPALINDGLNMDLIQTFVDDPILPKLCPDPEHRARLEDLINELKNTRASMRIQDQPTPKRALQVSLGGFSIQGFQRIKSLRKEDIATSAQWIFLTGDNGEGKTSLLQALATAFYPNQGWDLTTSGSTKLHAFLAIQDPGSSPRVCVGALSREPQHSTDRVFGYGTYRLRIADLKEEIGPVDNLLKGQGLADIEFVIKELTLKLDAPHLDKKGKTKLKHQLNQIFSTLVSLMPGIDRVTLEGADVCYYEKGHRTKRSQLSAGKKAINGLIGDLMARLILSDQGDKPFEQMSGLVLIDELEAHLHAKWQYELPRVLSKIFPCLQFIASTHSPIPLLGAPPDSLVWRMDHDEAGYPVLRELKMDLKRLTPNNLLTSPAFDFDEFLEDVADNQMYTDDQYRKIVEGQAIDKYLETQSVNQYLEQLARQTLPASFFVED